MGIRLDIAILLLTALSSSAERKAPLHNPALLNIGFVCRWQHRCMTRQERAMRSALAHVRKQRPPTWKVELCNRNAGRRSGRVDWIGFGNCIRNPRLAPAPRKRR